MKLRVIFWLTLGSVVSGLLFWQNTRRYNSKTIWWRIRKSAIELAILLLAAINLPVVLVAWACVWLTKPIDTSWVKATIGCIAGVVLGFLCGYALEAVILVSIFSIDEITGERGGFLSNLCKAKEEARSRKEQSNGSIRHGSLS